LLFDFGDSHARPSHLQLPGGPKMACAALGRRTICLICSRKAGRRLFAVWLV